MDCTLMIASFLKTEKNLPDGLVDTIQHGTNQEFLDTLSATSLDPQFTDAIFVHFESTFPELCARWLASKDVSKVVAALGRVLPFATHLSELAYDVLRSICPQKDLLRDEAYQSHHPDSLSCQKIKSTLLGIFRLLSFKGELFSDFIRPVTLLSLLNQRDCGIRYLTIRIICLYLYASDATYEDMVQKYLGDESSESIVDGIRIDFTLLSLWEEKRSKELQFRLEDTRIARARQEDRPCISRELKPNDLSESISDIQQVLLTRRQTSNIPLTLPQPIVRTHTTNQNIQNLAKALVHPEPVLINGSTGSGKTMVVNYLASMLNKSSSMITLHLNDQSDAKLLVGLYTAGPDPGSFQWRPGILTSAVTEGHWVFIEDLDRVPVEIMSVLMPLIERRELRIPGQSGITCATEGFRILATMKSNNEKSGTSLGSKEKMLGRRWWRHVKFGDPSASELLEIVVKRFPALKMVADQILTVFQRLRRGAIQTATGRYLPGARLISMRDVLKWCSRIETHFRTSKLNETPTAFSDSTLDIVLLDAADCLIGHMQGHSDWDASVSVIAEELHVHPQRTAGLFKSRVPSIQQKKLNNNYLTVIGRARLAARARGQIEPQRKASSLSLSFAPNDHSLRLMEKIAVAVQHREPLLLVGETGIGKTTAIQHISRHLGHRLLVMNLSQQSESGDLLGGYKPINPRNLMMPLRDDFNLLFEQTFSGRKNERFRELLVQSFVKDQWQRTIRLWKEAAKSVAGEITPFQTENPTNTCQKEAQRYKRRKIDSAGLASCRSRWDAFLRKVEMIEQKLGSNSGSFAFHFEEGKLVSAMRDGAWVLLDEINLASTDTLDCLLDLLESGQGTHPSLLLTESGTPTRVDAHKDFRVFASMNPATDIGKRDLPPGIRSRFTELYVDSPDNDVDSLKAIIEAYMRRIRRGASDHQLTASVTELYLEAQRLVSEGKLLDGSGQRPHYSLRTLSRFLSHAVSVAPLCSTRKALCEGFAMCFYTCLNAESEGRLHKILLDCLFSNAREARMELRKQVRPPEDGINYIQFTLQVASIDDGNRREEAHWLPRGPCSVRPCENYIITPDIHRNLGNLVRAASTCKYPILIQGPTSVGKTSMIEYLAQRSGNKLVRINNHEHTDLSEYFGNYVSGIDGNLLFQDGALVQALRKGYWVVLDELNLAPSDVLEALNRLLDDNRELFVPETQETIRPHPTFMLFATQNPVGLYGGRKALSRAFRNRFLELHFDDIPVAELQIILAKRSSIPKSWCGLIVEVYRRLSQTRLQNRVFEQQSFATLRDLFRWAFRGAATIESLARNGYMLLAEKVRNHAERELVKDSIQQIMSRRGTSISINEEFLYSPNLYLGISSFDQHRSQDMVWTRSMRRLYGLVSCALRYNEPVLLVGETGCGKTAVCQMISRAMGKDLYTVNAHHNLETGDIVGAQRPSRDKADIESDLKQNLKELLVDSLHTEIDSDDLGSLLRCYDELPESVVSSLSSEGRRSIKLKRSRLKALFKWQDGPLVQAMRSGSHFLLDEISLADDSVLERMNSVLDPHRSILLAEKGSSDSEVTAAEGFQVLATMNPGGDFGKKELSPALRNRFTEIWVPPLSNTDDVIEIVKSRLDRSVIQHSHVIVEFAKWFQETSCPIRETSISIRDILSWIEFVNIAVKTCDITTAVAQGAMTTFIDAIGANPSGLILTRDLDIAAEHNRCLRKLEALMGYDSSINYAEPVAIERLPQAPSMGVFPIPSNGKPKTNSHLQFTAPTTNFNAGKIIRALQLPKPVLLEGSPGVGKTSLVSAFASATSRPLVRMNLSEQTDVMDLFGSDVPLEDADAGHFTWRDAPFLSAMKNGEWVLLDEMNLASQSVLEGLNACIDHRGEAYIPELDRTFSRHPDFRLFATQNPHHQGGGRKGLPASFVNRFTVVYIDAFDRNDLSLICAHAFPRANAELVSSLVDLVDRANSSVNVMHLFGADGGPWEFNLRDAIRCLQLITSDDGLLPSGCMHDFVDLIFNQRLRNSDDISEMSKIIKSCFGARKQPSSLYFNLTPNNLQIGLGYMVRKQHSCTPSSKSCYDGNVNRKLMQALLICVQQRWPVVLTGPSGSGKSVAIASLASLVGADLEVLAMSPGLDANDLLGAYDQIDSSRHLEVCFREFYDQACRLLVSLLGKHKTASSRKLELCLAAVVEMITATNLEPDFLFNVGQKLDEVKQVALENDVRKSLVDLERILSEWTQAIKQNQVRLTGRFQWVDGPLVRALEQGRWLVLDNANLCSPSVLDRINSLLEPDGTLVVSEHCSKDGFSRTIRPHPDFRIFLAMDPRNGEISRAMRNRSMELFVHPSRPIETLPRHAHRRIYHGESRVSRFRDVIEFSGSFSGYDDSKTTKLQLRYAVEELAHVDLSDLDKFLSQAKSGLMPFESLDLFFHALERLQAIRTGQDSTLIAMRDHCRDLQRKISAPSSFETYQPVNILVNQQATYYKNAATSSSAIMAVGQFQEVKLDLMQLCTKLQQALDPANHVRPQARPVLSLIGDIAQVLAEWIKIPRYYTSCNLASISLMEGTISFLSQLLSNAQSQGYSEQLCCAQLSTRLKQVEALETQQSPIGPLCKAIKSCLRTALGPMEMSNGLSMERIWVTLRPRTIEKYERLQAIWRLEDIAEDSDRKIRSLRSSLDQKVAFRRSLIHASQVAFDQEIAIDCLANDIEIAVRRHGDADTFTLGEDSAVFRCTFNDLCQFIDLDQTRHQVQAEIEGSTREALRVLAGRGILAAFRDQAVGQPGIPKFHSLLSVLDLHEGPYQKLPFFGGLQEHLQQELHEASNVTLNSFEFLKSEVFILGKILSVASNALCANPIQQLHRHLHELHIQIMKVHAEYLVPEWLSAIESSMRPEGEPYTSIQSSNFVSTLPQDHFFRILALKYFGCPPTSALSAQNPSKDDWIDVGKCFISFAIGCLRLYVPDRETDPALRPRTERDLHQSLRKHLEDKILALSSLERFFKDQVSSLRSQLIKQRLEDLGPAPFAIAVPRPPPPTLAGLHAEFQSILRLVGRFDATKNTRDLIEISDGGVGEDIRRIIFRLQRNHRPYYDVTLPAIVFLNWLWMGLELVVHANKVDHQASLSRKLLSISLPLLGTNTTMWYRGKEIKESCLAMIGEEDQHLVMRILAFRSSAQKPSEWPEPAKNALNAVMNASYHRWRKRLESDRKEDAAASSLYDFRQGHDEEVDMQEKEFESMFGMTEAEKSRDQEPKQKADHMNPRNLAKTVADLHINVFLTPRSPSRSLLDLLKEVSSAASSAGIFDLNSPMSTIMLSNFLALNDFTERLCISKPDIRHYNIYKDCNILEAARIRDFIRETQRWVSPVLSACPEHFTLRNIVNVCNELLGFRLQEPLIKFITKTEQLHGFLAEWQSVTSREYSASHVFNRLTTIIISWRQLELSTWARLLDLETEQCIGEARAWWFIAYENVVLVPQSLENGDEDLTVVSCNLLRALEDFLRNSTLGQFKEKLRIIQSLQTQVKLHWSLSQTSQMITQAVCNLIQYFERWIPIVDAKIASCRHGLEKEIKNVIQLASWRDRNIHALREGAKASYQKLFRIVRKYRELLGQNATPLLSQPVAPPQWNAAKYRLHESLTSKQGVEVDQAALKLCQRSEDFWGSRAIRFKNTAATVQTMRTELGNNDSEKSAIAYLHGFLDNLGASVNRLRRETPPALTEKNSSTIKHLNSRKRRLLADTLKELRQMGFRSSPNPTTLESQITLANVMLRLSQNAGSEETKGYQELRAYFYGALDLMPQVRNAVREHSDDLNQSEVDRSVGYLESVLALTISHDSILARQSTDLNAFLVTFDKLRAVWEDSECKLSSNPRHAIADIEAIRPVLAWLPTTIQAGAKVIEAQASLGSLNFSTIITELPSWSSKLEELRIQVVSLGHTSTGLVYVGGERLVDQVQKILFDFRSRIEQWIEEFPLAKITLEHMLPWARVETVEAQSSVDGHAPTSVSDFNDELFPTMDMILAAVQDVAKASSLPSKSVNDSNWLLHSYDAKRMVLKSFNSSQILQSLDTNMAQLQHLQHSRPTELHLACASFALVRPILEEYNTAYHHALSEYQSLHLITCKAFYQLASTFCQVATQGFCNPVESNERQSGDSDNIEAGTGLGEGQGAEDVSKDVQDDEDLTELAEGQQGEGGDKKIDDHRDAVDIKDQLEGGGDGEAGSEIETDSQGHQGEDREGVEGDVEGGKVEGGDGKEPLENGGDETMEEGVGSVDGFEPSAVDEKFWDQAGDEENDEKQIEETSGSKNATDPATAANESSKKDKALDKPSKVGETEAEGSSDEGEEDDTSIDESLQDARPQQGEFMDPHMKEEQGLELPEDLDFDRNKADEEDEGGSEYDEDMPDFDQEEEARQAQRELDAEDANHDSGEEAAVASGGKEEKPSPDPDNASPAETVRQDQQAPYSNEDAGNGNEPGFDQGNNGEEITHELDIRVEQPPAFGPRENQQHPSSSSRTALGNTGSQIEPLISNQASQAQATEGQASSMQEERDTETVRKLGDIFEKWYRQQSKIQDKASDRGEGQAEKRDVDMANANFEHIRGDEDQWDAQALAPSDRDQARALDETMAMDSTEPDGQDRDDKFLPDVDEGTEETHQDMEIEDKNPSAPDQENNAAQNLKPPSYIGERKRSPPPGHQDQLHNTQTSSQAHQDSQDLEEDLSTMQIDPPATPPPPFTDPVTLWHHHERLTRPLSLILTEQLRLILAPTVATKLRGDFRTGKRLNIKRIIPYIASGYRRDKIWMRRSVPTKRAYQILLAIDDSRSMVGDRGDTNNNNKNIPAAAPDAANLAFSTLALLARSLTALEAGDIGVARFGADFHVAHPLGAPFTPDAGAAVLQQFTFQQQRTDVKKLIASSVDVLREARMRGDTGAADLWQLQMIISDGIFEDHDGVRRELLRAQEERVMVFFVVVDAGAAAVSDGAGTEAAGVKGKGKGKGKEAKKQSIVELERVEFVPAAAPGGGGVDDEEEDGEGGDRGEMRLERKKYLDSFPFKYYLVVRDVRDLPDVLSAALRQWFAEVAEL